MISCGHIKKSYTSQKVLDDFSFEFKDTGFYLLFGESGSGKTTLLNILAGQMSYDDGVVDFCGERYDGRVDAEVIEPLVDYITQDTYFIDYLSVYENLALCTTDNEAIEEYLVKFGLFDRKDMLPGKLSGGEKQRISLIRSLIRGKKVLLLDEPTAALDCDNKKFVFELLAKLKEEVLIICSSHDEMAKNYADECVDFNNLQKYAEHGDFKSDSLGEGSPCDVQKYMAGVAQPARKLAPFVKKWFSSPLKDRSVKIWLGIVLVIAFAIMWLSDDFDNKMEATNKYIYKRNVVGLSIEMNELDYMNELYQRDDIKEIVMSYSGSVPNGIDVENPSDLSATADYELDGISLPLNQENIKLDDLILYGRYIENENEILLYYDTAMRADNPEQLIGTTVDIKLYDGEYKMTIVGIVREIAQEEVKYFESVGTYIDEDRSQNDDIFFVSAELTNKLANDENFHFMGGRYYLLYFESYSEAKAFYDEMPKDNYDIMYEMIGGIVTEDSVVFAQINQWLFPIGIFAMLFAVLFYYQTQKTEIKYNKKIFAVYQYLGYSVKKIKRIWVLYSMWELIKIVVVSGVTAYAITSVINIINRREYFIMFEIFSYSWDVVLKTFTAIMLVAIVNITLMLHKMKAENINQELVGQRDLL